MKTHLGAGALLAALASGGALGQEPESSPPVTFNFVYTADLIGVLDGGAQRRSTYLDNFDLMADADLAALIGWRGAVMHIDILNTSGGMPNAFAGTLQGLDNIEVASHRLRLFEAWIEQSLGAHASLRLGLYDLNSEFYANDAAGLLLGPSFGIGPELAATGVHGPSIFPSTALALRVDAKLGGGGFIRAAILDADAGVPGDPGGIDTSFDHGVLLIAEGGIEGARKLSLGVWRYSRRQDDIRMAQQSRIAEGAYVTFEQPLNDPDGVRAVRAFLRAGLSDGETTPFAGGWQAGFLVSRVFADRPDSQLSFGVSQALLSNGYSLNQRDAGIAAANGEVQIELTYADTLFDGLAIQPDLQWIGHPGGDRAIPAVLAAGLRITLDL